MFTVAHHTDQRSREPPAAKKEKVGKPEKERGAGEAGGGPQRRASEERR
jgi:hypothetical protein